MSIEDVKRMSPDELSSLLGRMEADCLYYLGNDGKTRCSKHLWARDEQEQIEWMRAIYRQLTEVYQMELRITEQQIDEFAMLMLVD